jgi:tetratricopeptide (TPR) repeat protein
MSVTVFAFAAALIAVPAPVAPPFEPIAALAQHNELAAQPLAAGREAEAMAVLEKASAADPHDAAVLINLGIAYAQAGDDTKARSAFEAALACHEVVELDTADGTSTDSRRLARKAIKMLERGEFRPASARREQLTYRD